MSTDTSSQTRSGRMVLLLIAGIPVTMILAATWLWFFVARGDLDLVGILGTANHGTLVQPPRQIREYSIVGVDDTPFNFDQLDPRWTFVIPASGDCLTGCERRLYLTRQIHAAMGKEQSRIRRVYLSDTPVADTKLEIHELSDGRQVPPSFAQYLEKEHRGVRVLTIDAQESSRLFSGLGDSEDSWFLIDPAGWIMMSYSSGVNYKNVISDLKFLLKNSGD